jgi:hypothetical protein
MINIRRLFTDEAGWKSTGAVAVGSFCRCAETLI